MNKSIKARLLAGFALLLCLFVGMLFFMLYQFRDINSRFSKLSENASEKIEYSHQVLQEVLEISRAEKDLHLVSRPQLRDPIENEILQSLKTIERLTAELEKLSDPRGKRILEAFSDSWMTYTDYLFLLMDLETQRDSAFRDFSHPETYRESAALQLEALIAKNRGDIETEKASREQEFEKVLSIMLLLILAAVGLAVLMMYWIVGSVNKRIRTIAAKAERIASREHPDEVLVQTIDDELNPIVSSLININESFREITEDADRIASGDYAVTIEPRSGDDRLGISLQKMARALRNKTRLNEKNAWLSTGLNQFNDRIIGNQDIRQLADNIIGFLSTYLKANIGAIYLMNEEGNALELKGSYAFSPNEQVRERFSLQEGFVGQAARERKRMIVSGVNPDHLRINSGLVEGRSVELVVIPFLFEEKVLGVIEMGRLSAFKDRDMEFLESALENIALAVHSAEARKKVEELLAETQVQSEELQTQQEELRQMNEELEEQTQNLKQQQEELQVTNQELEEQTQALNKKNQEIEAAKSDVEEKTRQLEVSSKYKSEFLANMSHELRTPLNSLLILSRDLADNKNGNLDEDQVESAEIIYNSGEDLLALINEVLDLSRVEAGKMTLHLEKVRIREFLGNLIRTFKHQATQKGLELREELDSDLPEFIQTDPQRLSQILKNLISNALKFTDTGRIEVAALRKNEDHLAISVRDTGIGIKKEKQLAIFEAFQQADGGTARKYGGTGLGLSISREMARLLSGEITLTSEVGRGSEFTLMIPLRSPLQEAHVEQKPAEPNDIPAPPREEFLNYPTIDDDRQHIRPGDRIVLIIEDDLSFARILKKQANEKSFKALTASTGEDGLVLVERFKPNAVILDIDLPGISGREVLSRIKENPETRHIPVHVVSVDERTLDPIREGAVEYLVKPIAKAELDKAFNRIENFVSRKMKNLLIVEDDGNSRKAIRKLIGNGDVQCLEAGSGKEALAELQKNEVDCIVLDIGLPDMSGFELISELERREEAIPPIIIYTGRELSREENEELERHAESIIIKGVKSEERLLDETALFLHRTVRNLPEAKQRIITDLHPGDAALQGKKVLVVDDDMRNVFALSKVLKQQGMEILKADNGKMALGLLDDHKDVDLVLMDIMMPEMDGYEAMRRIREQPRFRELPVIALTAKAMKDDKEKCIRAGANDYIPKPVDVGRLISLIQVWVTK